MSQLPTPKPIVVSYSELDAFRQCPHKHELAHKQRWTPEVVGPALNRGRLWHKLMEIHYGCIRDQTLASERRSFIASYILDNQPDDEEAALLGWMYDGYEERWHLDQDWLILDIEKEILAPLPNPNGNGESNDPPQFYLRMRLDLLIQERFKSVAGRQVKAAGPGKIHIIDHKTGKDLPKDKELDIDDQFGLYTWGARADGIDIFGSLHNAVRTYRHKEERPVEERFARTRLYRTERELETIALEAAITARTAYAYGPGEAPRAPDPDRCTWRCPYTQPCLVGRKSGPAQERLFLQAGGFQELTEREALIQRGYEDPKEPELSQ